MKVGRVISEHSTGRGRGRGCEGVNDGFNFQHFNTREKKDGGKTRESVDSQKVQLGPVWGAFRM